MKTTFFISLLLWEGFLASVMCQTTTLPIRCYVSGECTNSISVDISTTEDEFECLQSCQSDSNCEWFTFSPQREICQLFSNCYSLSTAYCSDCISGENECTVPTCWIQGECEGSLLHSEEASSGDRCLQLCKSNYQCTWFTYFEPGNTCFLFSNCSDVDASCDDCISGERLCSEEPATTTTIRTTSPRPTTGPPKTTTSTTTTTVTYTTQRPTTTLPPGVKLKMMVATGLSELDSLSNVEVVDLSSSNTICENLSDFPIENYYAAGGLTTNDKPLICGGRSNESECYLLENNQWKSVAPLNVGRHGHAMCKSPFSSSTLIVTGGFGLNSSEVLTETSWKISVALPVEIYFHCMVSKTSTQVIAIGGFQNGRETGRTFTLSSEQSTWSQGPALRNPRSLHSCGSIRKTSQSSDKSIIVVGGEHNGVGLNSVEILDFGSSEWRRGPDLPMAFHTAAMVEDSYGGVLVVGGYIDSNSRLDTIYRFPHGGFDANWEMLPQKLETGRYAHVALLIPDRITNCTFV